MHDRSYPFPTYSGLISPEHRERMGTAIWEFLWCIDKTTKEYVRDGELRGVVLGGKPVKAEEIGESLGEHYETVKKNLRRLQKEGYIELKRTPYGHIIEVRKSKKFINRQSEIASSGQSENILSGESQNASSDERESENALSPGKNASSGRSQNASSNKTLQLDITEDKRRIDREMERGSDPLPSGESDGMPTSVEDAAPPEISRSPFSRIEMHLAKKMGVMNIPPKDYPQIEKLLKDGIPEDVIISGIDRSFENFVPSYEGERIRSIKYCIPAIRQIHTANVEREKAVKEVASGTVRSAYRPPQQKRTRVKSEYIEKLRRAGAR